MPRNITLYALRNTAQRRAGLRGSEDVSNDDWNDIINNSIARVWAQVTKNDIGYGRKRTTIPTIAGEEEYLLPEDHMSTVGLYRPSGSNLEKMERVTESWYLDNHSNDDDNSPGLPGLYWYTPAGIIIRPIPTKVENLEILYVQTSPVLVDDTDVLDTIVNFDDCIVEYTCAEAQQKPGKRQQHTNRADTLMSQNIAKWGTRRDRGPNYVKMHRPRRSRFGR